MLGFEYLYRQGPTTDDRDTGENFFPKYVGLNPRTWVDIAMVRCGNGANVELFQFDAPDQNRRMPRFSDFGGAHLCVYVDDAHAGLDYLLSKNVHVHGGADGVWTVPPGPEAGKDSTSIHCLTPWVRCSS